MSGWDSLLSSFGLSPSNLRTDFRSNNSNPQGVRRMKGRQGVTQEQEDNRRQHLAGTSSGPLRKVGMLYHRTHAILTGQPPRRIGQYSRIACSLRHVPPDHRGQNHRVGLNSPYHAVLLISL